MTTNNDHDLSFSFPISPAPPSPIESDLDSLSWGSSSSSPSSPPALHALSLSTTTSSSLARKESNLSGWSEGEVQRGMAVSAPVSPLQLPMGRGEGRKRSLTDVLRVEAEEERVRVALELSLWINASPSPFEKADSPRATPLSTPIPRPQFPLFRPSGITQSLNIATPQSVSDALGLDHRGLPIERKAESKGKVSTCGFIPFVPIPSSSSGNAGEGEGAGEVVIASEGLDEVQGS